MIAIPIKNDLRTEIREFFKLAIPLAGAQVAQSATGFADTIMMGRMGADILAAGGLAAVLFISIMVTASGLVMGVSPLVAEAFGAGQKTRIQQIARQGLWLALLVSIPIMIGTAHLDTWLSHTGQAETTVALVNTYLDIILWGLFPAVGFAALRSTVSALSQAQPIMTIITVGTVFNILGNYVLGFGKWGFPAMELAGLALATALAWWGMFIALVLYVCLHPALRAYRIFQGLHRVRPKILWQLVWVGVPIGIFTGLETGFFTVITFWVGTLGTEVLAAHQVVFQTIVVAFMVPLGISYATTVRVGQWLGQRNLAGIQQATWVSISITTLLMLVFSSAFLLFPTQIIGLYLDVQDPANAPIIELALPLLKVAAIAQVLDGVQKAVYGALQGLQDTQVPTILNILGFWGVGLSVGYGLGFYLGLGSVGLWIGQSVAIAAVATLFIGRFCQLMAQRKRQRQT
ncbi:MAG: MATE family efflux transporter [Cyanobacteria bacterium P01_G01_bin.38]